MNISFGVITRDLVSAEPIIDFLENAAKHRHDIYSVVIAYSNAADPKVVDEISSRVRLDLVPMNKYSEMFKDLSEIGISEKAISTLLRGEADSDQISLEVHGDPSDGFTKVFKPKKSEHSVDIGSPANMGLVPYGKNRNNVILKAIQTGVDILVFIDTDVYPYMFVQDGDDAVRVDIDFIGRHLEYLEEDRVKITTSDYSGYYIIPPMRFEGMEDLFKGLQKEGSYEYIQKSYEHNCLALDSHIDRKPFKSNKILGGNVAIKLDIFKDIYPFFSTTYEFHGREYLTRGEDTLLGLEMARSTVFDCIDIDTRIFHNTYGTYPQVPNILGDEKIRSRFFHACMGWIGRNPFLNWISGEDVQEKRRNQRESLDKSAHKAADFFKDERFLMLPDALEASYGNLPRVIETYRDFVSAWDEIQQNWDKWRCSRI